MPDKTVFTGDGGSYTYHPALSHTGHDKHGSKHHRKQHGDDFDSDGGDDPIKTNKLLDKPGGDDGLEARLAADVSHTDKAHLVLKGKLMPGEYFFRCINQIYFEGEVVDVDDDVFYIDDVGNVECSAVNGVDIVNLYTFAGETSEDVDLNTADIEEMGEFLELATPSVVGQALVQRDLQGSVEVQDLTANKIFARGLQNTIAIHGDGAFWYIAYIDDVTHPGTSIIDTTATYRFGRNIEEPGELGGAGDGLEMKHNDQELLIQVQADNSTIFIKGIKSSPSARFIEIRDESREIFYVDRDGDVMARKIHCESLVPLNGSFDEIKVDRIRTRKNSMWLGERLHVTEARGLGRLLFRNAIVPTYLQNLNVQAGDLPAGITLETATLDHWIELSEANSGSSDLDVIFPEASEHLDFDRKTTLNELLIKPEQKHATTGAFQATQNAGITIQQPAAATGGHPFLNLQGSEAGIGAGLIHFETMVSGTPQTVAALLGVKATGGAAKYLNIQVPGGTSPSKQQQAVGWAET